jgi:hypothetical protein
MRPPALICEKCDQENVASAEFCTWCGTPLEPVVDENAIPHRDLGQLIGHTFHLYGKNFWQFILIGLPPQVLGLLVLLLVPDLPQGFSSDFASDSSRQEAIDDFADAVPVLLFVGLATALATIVVVSATIHAVGMHYLGSSIDVMVSLRRGLSKLLTSIVVGILLVLAIMVMSPLLIILIGIPVMIFVAISWVFAIQLVMIQGAGPVEALKGSWNLASGNRWRILGIGIVYALLQMALQFLITVVTGAVDGVNQSLATVLSGIGYAVIAPIAYIGLTVLYFDLRSRDQRLTLDSLAVEMGEQAPMNSRPEDLRDM